MIDQACGATLIMARARVMSPPGTFETSTDVRYTAAFGGNADISQRLPTAASYAKRPVRRVPEPLPGSIVHPVASATPQMHWLERAAMRQREGLASYAPHDPVLVGHRCSALFCQARMS